MIETKLSNHLLAVLLLLLWSQTGLKASAQQQPGMTDVRAVTEAVGPANLPATGDEVCLREAKILACLHEYTAGQGLLGQLQHATFPLRVPRCGTVPRGNATLF
jgi:hypothetical protein